MIDHNDPGEEVPPVTAEMQEYITLPDRQVWTLDDLLALPDDGHRYEIFDGSLLMSAAARPAHQIAADCLVERLKAVAPDDLYPAREVAIDLQFGAPNHPIPDVVVGPRAVMCDLDTTHLMPAQVFLLAEVMSPSSVGYDRIHKPALYAKAGISNYWRIELRGPGAPIVVVHELADGVYRELATVRAGEALEVTEPYSFVLRPSDLLGQPAGD
jgi:Uma2 family endonuclease